MSRRNGNTLTDVGKFNNNLEKLFQDLEYAYPEDSDLPYYRDKISLARRANAKMIVEQFMVMVEKYIEQIMLKNDKFFIDLNVCEEGLVDNNYIQLVQKIKSLWLNMTEASQQSIWKYFQILVTLAIRALKRRDLLPTLNKYRATPLVF